MSSVRLIIADGGKREEGALKEKRARNRLVRPANESEVAWCGCAERSDKPVRKIGRKMKQNIRSIKRGGRMSTVEGYLGGARRDDGLSSYLIEGLV